MAEPDGEGWINEMLAKAMLGDDPDDGQPMYPPPSVSQSTESLPVTGSVAPPADTPNVPSATPDADRARPRIASTATLVDLPPENEGGPTDDAPASDVDSNSEEIDAPSTQESSFVRGVLEWIVVLVGAVVVALVLRTFLFQAFWIPSESMEGTLLKQDRVLVNKLSYDLHDVHRGDVVVFRRPDEDQSEIRDLIKRVIGLPGETIEGRDGSIYINGARLIEPYLDPADEIRDFGPTLVPEGEFFMMGDNRDESYDSRFFGTVAEDRIVGRAFVLFWPFDRIGTL